MIPHRQRRNLCHLAYLDRATTRAPTVGPASAGRRLSNVEAGTVVTCGGRNGLVTMCGPMQAGGQVQLRELCSTFGRGQRVRFTMGGGGGIRTHDDLATTTVFETVRFVHSRTPPTGLSCFRIPGVLVVCSGPSEGGAVAHEPAIVQARSRNVRRGSGVGQTEGPRLLQSASESASGPRDAQGGMDVVASGDPFRNVSGRPDCMPIPDSCAMRWV